MATFGQNAVPLTAESARARGIIGPAPQFGAESGSFGSNAVPLTAASAQAYGVGVGQPLSSHLERVQWQHGGPQMVYEGGPNMGQPIGATGYSGTPIGTSVPGTPIGSAPQHMMVQEGGANMGVTPLPQPYMPNAGGQYSTGASADARALMYQPATGMQQGGPAWAQSPMQGGTYASPLTGAGTGSPSAWNPSTGNPLASANIYAGKTQAQGADEARRAAEASYAQGRRDLAAHEGQIGQILSPSIQAGQTATQQLAGYEHTAYDPRVSYMGPQGPNPYSNVAGEWGGFSQADLQNDPGFQYRMLEAQKAIERSAAAGSGAMSGATLSALQEQSQNMASAEFQQARNRALEDYRTRHQVGVTDHQMRLADSQNQQAIHAANFARQAQDYDLQNKKGMVEATIQQFLAEQGQSAGQALGDVKTKFAALQSQNSLQNLQASMQSIMNKYDAYANAAIGAENAIYGKWEAEQNIQLSREQTAAQVGVAKRGQDRSLVGAGIGAAGIVMAATQTM